MTPRPVHKDCRHYRGDRPCRPHKESGVFCESCPRYERVETRALVIKLGAAGDVLRTTALLEPLRRQYPNARVTWLCGPASFGLIRDNPLIDRPLPLSPEALLALDHEEFDLCANFDLDAAACAAEGRVRAAVRKGFASDSRGGVFAREPAGETWLQMSLWDDLKRANRLTYQEHMLRILGAEGPIGPIMTPLLPEAVERAEAWARKKRLWRDEPVIGFNVGAGARWQHKKWTVEGFAGLAERIHRETDSQILLLYGPEDEPRVEELRGSLTVPFADPGSRESVTDFIAILNLCGVVVTGDTLALHAAAGLGKQVVCLVGPTAAQELELYGQGFILQGDIDCLGCYLERCGKDPHCMNLLTSGEVFDAVKTCLERLADE